jgi:protein SCO1/2
MRGSFAIGLIAISLSAATALASPGDGRPAFGDNPLPPPPTYKAGAVTVDEKLGSQVPLDTPFRTSDGKAVTLGDVLGTGSLPTILTFNYSDCPMLCSLQLNALSAALPELATENDPALPPLKLGVQYRVVTIDLEPNEPIDKLQKMKARYIERTHADPAGWTFLSAGTPGDSTGIAHVADAVGFRYTYLKDKAEYAHPASLIFLSSRGVVTRYLHGTEYTAPVMRDSLVKAGFAEPSTTVGFLNVCYHYDPDANSHAHAGVVAMRIAAGSCIVLLLSAFGVARITRKRREHEESQS